MRGPWLNQSFSTKFFKVQIKWKDISTELKFRKQDSEANLKIEGFSLASLQDL